MHDGRCTSTCTARRPRARPSRHARQSVFMQRVVLIHRHKGQSIRTRLVRSRHAGTALQPMLQPRQRHDTRETSVSVHHPGGTWYRLKPRTKPSLQSRRGTAGITYTSHPWASDPRTPAAPGHSRTSSRHSIPVPITPCIILARPIHHSYPCAQPRVPLPASVAPRRASSQPPLIVRGVSADHLPDASQFFRPPYLGVPIIRA